MPRKCHSGGGTIASLWSLDESPLSQEGHKEAVAGEDQASQVHPKWVGGGRRDTVAVDMEERVPQSWQWSRQGLGRPSVRPQLRQGLLTRCAGSETGCR